MRKLFNKESPKCAIFTFIIRLNRHFLLFFILLQLKCLKLKTV